jgi:colanic acid/amylovoran biosynthesis glycosyltransferase
MRVLHLFNIFGALTERAMSDYTLGLSRRGLDLTIGHETWAAEAPHTHLPRIQLQRVPLEPTANVPAQMQQIAEHVTDPAMLELLAKPFDLIHGHFGPRILQGAAWLAHGVPMIVSLYGYDVARLLHDPCWIDRYLWAAQHGATFVALARSMEEKLLNLGLPRDRVKRIHLGIDLAAHPYYPSPAPESPRFVFIGRFVEKKGTDVLIDAMAHLVRELATPATLDLIGTGPNEGALRQQVDHCRLIDRVNFIGVVPFASLFDYLKNCSALVQPSIVAPDGDAEGAPMVLMTAQASGVPCVTTHHSGNPETIPLIGHRFIVPERDPIALAEAMKRMINQSEQDRSALQLAGRRWIEEHFNLDRTVEEYAALYQQLLRATSVSDRSA